MKNRLFFLDFIKFLAALFITNSHFLPLYENVNPAFATFGVHGNALFFFVSGYLVMLGKNKMLSFKGWFFNKIKRIIPATLLCIGFALLFCDKKVVIDKVIFSDCYWFIKCILIYYAITYFILKYPHITLRGKRWNTLYFCFYASCLIAVVAAFSQQPNGLSLFHTKWHYVCFLPIMLWGAMCQNRYNMPIRLGKFDYVFYLLSFLGYFIISAYVKNRHDNFYYLQLLNYPLLIAFTFYTFKCCNCLAIEKISSCSIINRCIRVISGLTLEIYLVQFYIISNKFNELFPYNLLIMFLIICLFAYFLKVITATFLYLCKQNRFSDIFNI